MAINDSTIAYNEAKGGNLGSGGGISNAGALTIKNSTISKNTASEDGGGIVTAGGTSTLDLDSVTLTENTASGGSGTANGGALSALNGSSVSVRNSILAGNSGDEDCYVFLGPLTDNGHNLVQTQTNCGFANAVNGNIVGQDPLLDTRLFNNGGPTRTHALLTGSPAIDAGDTELGTDQRGYPRPSGSADDIGAFEEAQLGNITVEKRTFGPDATDYAFTLDGGRLVSPIDFQLDTSIEDSDDINDTLSFDLEAGDYSLTEEVLEGQPMGPVAIACEDSAGPIGNFTGATADISLAAYQDITCTVTNDAIYWITATAEGPGSVSCSPSFVGKGESSTCTAVADFGFRVKEWTGACAGVGSTPECYLSKIREDQDSTVVFEELPVVDTDTDGDGVPDGEDWCEGTPLGAVVDANGCSIDQSCDCDGARNHGQYVSCIARTARAFERAGLIDANEKGVIVSEAAQSQCGK